jgi:hypothetical protein
MMLAALGFAIVVIVAGDFFLYPRYVSDLSSYRDQDLTRVESGRNKFNKNKNGLWLRYFWYAGKHTAKEEEDLAKFLQTEQILFAYFHVREVDKSGRLVCRYRESAKRLVNAIHKHSPSVLAIAWVSAGQWYPAHGTNIKDPLVRRQMVKEAKFLINECGFDGVQWDYEPCANEDTDLPKLLAETKGALKTKFVGVATPMWYPPRLKLWYPQWYSYGWSESYFSQIAQYCDQMALMCYDTGSIYPRAYEWLVAQQPIHLENALKNNTGNCTYILGLSTYDRNFLHDHCETQGLGIQGAVQGMKAVSDFEKRTGAVNGDTKCDGIALFADYTTDDKEWRLYNSMWRD